MDRDNIKSHTVKVRVTKEQREFIERESARRGISQSEILRELINKTISKNFVG